MSSPIKHPPIKRFEVTCVHSPPDANVDIVLVHGLNGHPEKTWTAKNGVFWPTDLLPASLKGAKARILVYGYNADVYAFGADRSASSDMIHQHAQTLVSGLAMERLSEDCDENPIVWVVHSLRGILLKRALELSNDLTSKSADPSRSIYVSTYGIIFLGTPHTGADPAKWASLLQGLADAIIPKKVMDTEPHLVQTLKSNNEVLQNINLHFLDIYQRFEIDMVHESVKTDMKGFKAFVVDQASASPQLPGVRYYGIEASHSTMCKFESKSAPGYLNVSTTVRSWVVDCLPVIQSRWKAERRARQQVRENEAKELLGIYTDPPARPSQGSNAVTPGKLQTRAQEQAFQHEQHRRGLVEEPRPSRQQFFETAEVEERDEEVVDR